MKLKKNNRPKSEINYYVNLLGIILFIFSIYAFHKGFITFENNNLSDKDKALYEVKITLVTILATIIPIIIFDLFIFKMFKKEQVKLSARNPFNPGRVIIKLFGLIITFASIIFIYWLLPEYGDWYKRYFYLLEYIFYPSLIFALFYFPFIDKRMEDPLDSYWHIGNLFLSAILPNKRNMINKSILAEHARNWAVKAFFFPLMFIFLSNDIIFLLEFDYSKVDFSLSAFDSPQKFGRLFDFLYSFIFTIDVAFAAIGYMMTFKILNSHIRSVEPTVLGWAVCIMCYPPFWAGFFANTYFAYNNDYYWGEWLGKDPKIYVIWGSTILILIAIYTLATIALGYRFSNLTYRGLVTSGPYRYTKHPAYITKCLSWWLISIPFISNDGWISAVKMSLLLAGLCFIYFLRARTEENHLSNYPEYVEYAEWMNENGVFRFVGKLLPFLKYDENRAKKSGSIIWNKKQ